MVSSTLRRFTDEEQNDICYRYNNGQSILSIMKQFPCSDGVIKRVLERNNITIYQKNTQKNHNIDREFIIEQYKSGKGFTRISKDMGIGYSVVRNIIHKSGLPITNFNKKIDVDDLWISELFNNGLLLKEISVITDYSMWSISKSLKKQNIDTRERHKNPKTEFEDYKNLVLDITKYNWNKYYTKINPSNKSRGRFHHHLDHIFSISEGFNNNVPPEIIGHYTNLQMLWWKDNVSKGSNSHKSKKSLLEDYQKSIKV